MKRTRGVPDDEARRAYARMTEAELLHIRECFEADRATSTDPTFIDGRLALINEIP